MYQEKCSLSEAKKLMKIWDKGNHKTNRDSIRYHVNKHGDGKTLKYLRKAYNFNKKGAHKVTRIDGSTIYKLMLRKVFPSSTDFIGGYSCLTPSGLKLTNPNGVKCE